MQDDFQEILRKFWRTLGDNRQVYKVNFNKTSSKFLKNLNKIWKVLTNFRKILTNFRKIWRKKFVFNNAENSGYEAKDCWKFTKSHGCGGKKGGIQKRLIRRRFFPLLRKVFVRLQNFLCAVDFIIINRSYLMGGGGLFSFVPGCVKNLLYSVQAVRFVS